MTQALPPLYLDHNATVPMRPAVMAAIMDIMRIPANASSVHAYGRQARRLVEEARAAVAALIGTQANQVIFNSGATEGNNTVLKYIGAHFEEEQILVSAIEHPSVLEAAPKAARIRVDPQGILDLSHLESLLKEKKTSLVSVMHANNETGAIQPVAEIAALCNRHGAFFHCDAVQALGKITLDFGNAGIDFLTLSAHKIGGPQGIGALVFGGCGVTPVLLEGGGQEKKARAGTENVAGIYGFGIAAREALAGFETYQALRRLRDGMEERLQEIAPGLIVHARDAPRLPNTSMVSLPGIGSETLLMAFDLEGICLSNGSACSSGTVRASHVLRAMGAEENAARCALRISLGHNTTAADIERLIEAWSKITGRFKH